MSDLKVYKWRIWCIAESKYVYVWGTEKPTVCPINTAHTIQTSTIASVYHIEENNVQIREETTETGGHIRVQGKDFSVDGPTGATGPYGPVSTSSWSSEVDMGLLSMSLTTRAENVGDELTIYCPYHKTIGTLGANVDVGASTFTVSSTVIDNAFVGMYLTLTDGTNLDECGIISSIDTETSQITSTICTTHSFSVASPTYVQISVCMLGPDFQFPPHIGRHCYGTDKIGSSYVPKNTEFVAHYRNYGTTNKKWNVDWTYLY